MRIFDAHVHAEEGFAGYGVDAACCNVIFNSVASYERYAGELDPSWTRSLVLDFREQMPFVRREVASGAVTALKIHARIQRIAAEDYDAVAAALRSIPEPVPVIVDAFYHGPDLRYQPDLGATIELIRAFPDRHWVIAHCGGHRLLDWFFHLRTLGNVSYELSYALQYLSDSSLFTDLTKLVRFTPRDRVLFGSDWPAASPARQVALLHAVLDDCDATPAERALVFHDNARALFGRPVVPGVVQP